MLDSCLSTHCGPCHSVYSTGTPPPPKVTCVLQSSVFADGSWGLEVGPVMEKHLNSWGLDLGWSIGDDVEQVLQRHKGRVLLSGTDGTPHLYV